MFDTRDIVWVFKTDAGWTWQRLELDGENAGSADETWPNEQGARNSALDEVARHGGSIRIERPRYFV
jgi:hypothetical protein